MPSTWLPFGSATVPTMDRCHAISQKHGSIRTAGFCRSRITSARSVANGVPRLYLIDDGRVLDAADRAKEASRLLGRLRGALANSEPRG